ncbi:branched-chain amino acid ABC transporter substrate-binding protein [Planosporangium mesophilum]|uniref:Branched chain amino acid ABC transporter substrate-binding protein n=1 Tax=Planosporangium mesophilum TaxID=689768 RepID=A0A8J3T9H5_9ACTN|nr:branched-chain amino acid ABC transporter substrate-binding protein [Planosporangium mesophilum]NJC83940.1 ABC transporter substrate-binding protein [Planosporangium mesophilum]GII22693.1 branched chain amino acid ABC transporter substrate-binding protein [Planosporangium mesophilum]
MRVRLGVVTVATAVLASAVLAGCAAKRPPQPAQPAPVRLGALVPLSGRNSPSGQAMVDAQQLAVREANEAGGVLGRRVELVVEDDACDPGTAVVAADKLIARDITVSVGGYCSSATVPTLKTFRNAGIPMVIPLSNSAELLQPRYDSVFLVCGTAEAEARFALQSMARLGSHRLAVVHDGTSFPLSLAGATVDAARTSGGVELTGEFELSQGAPSYTRTALQVRDSGADTVYFTGYYAEANRLIIDLRAAGFTGQIMVGDGAVDGPLLENLSPEQSKGVSGTTFMVPEFMPALADWSGRFTKAVGHAPGPSAPEAYDAVKLALDAIRRAGGLDRDAVRRAIAGTTELTLLSGDPRFNPDGTRVTPTFLLLAVRDNRFVYVSSTGPA